MLVCKHHISRACIVPFPFFGRKPESPKPLPLRRAGVAPAAVDGELEALTEGRGVQVEDGGSGLAPCIEQAAILYAADHLAEACAVLENEVERGEAPEQAWLMLFELYQQGGEGPRFDALALDFAARFEKSPPAWENTASPLHAPPAMPGRAVLPLGGRLDARSAEALKQLRRMVAGNALLRVDLAKLRDADAAGCALLLAVLEEMRQAKRECLLSGMGPLSAILAGKVHAGLRQDDAIWRLLLELLQRQGLQAAFEETALQFALTFELSPPSWRAPTAPAAAAPEVPAAAPAEGLRLQGRLVSAGPESFAFLLAASGDRLEVDASRLQRIDFVSAGILLNTVLALHHAGKRVRIHHLSHLIAALFASVGIGRWAVLETKNN